MKSRSAWVFTKNDSWHVGWYDPVSGARRQKSLGPKKSDATKYAAKKTAELVGGISGDTGRKTWEEFRQEIEAATATVAVGTQREYLLAMDHFARIVKPKTVADVGNKSISDFANRRRREQGRTPGSETSPATVNKELRSLKKVFRLAAKWKYLPEQLEIEFLREPKVAPTFLTEEQFASLYRACDAATAPVLPNISTEDWWRAYLIFCYLTGWRMSEPLKLLWQDVDLEAGYAITRAGDNKGGKEFKCPLADIVIVHLRKIRGFDLDVFGWPLHRTGMNDQLHKIQTKAGIKKVCRKDHKHTASCEWFGFHDLRRSFATQNAASLSADQLQQMMRHKSYTTTQKYIEMARQTRREDVVSRLSIPNLKIGGAE